MAFMTRASLLSPTFLVLSALPAIAVAQGVESSPTGVEDMLPASSSEKSTKENARGWLGVMLTKPDDGEGVEVTQVLRGSPALEGGLKRGDRILRIDGKKVSSVADVQARVRQRKARQTTRVVIHRGGEEQKVAIALSAAPGTQKLLERQFVGHRAPDFSANTVGDSTEEVTLEELSGKPIVVDFWATWCGPCRPLSQKLGKLSQKLGDNVHFVGLTSEQKKTVEQHLARNSSKFPVATTDEQVMQDYLIESYPTVFVIDAEGKVRGVFVGLGHFDAIEKLVAELAEQ